MGSTIAHESVAVAALSACVFAIMMFTPEQK
jgi:hypothetical protein